MTTTTRFYFASTTAAAVSPAFDADWGVTGSAVRRKLKTVPAGSGSTGSVAVAETSASQIDVLNGQFISDGGVLPVGPITGTFDLVAQLRESGIGQADMFQQVRIHVFDSTGTTKRGTIYDGQTFTAVSATAADPNGEFGFSTGESRILVGIPLVVGTTAQSGDILVVEHGCRACNVSTTSRTCTVDYRDDAVADSALTAGLTGNFRPWLDLHLAAAPNVPTNLSYTTPDDTTLAFEWDAPVGGDAATGYEVRIDGGSSTDVFTDLDYDFTGLPALTVYLLEVRAYNAAGFSAWVSLSATTTGTVASAYMPDVMVEIAFDSGYTTAEGDRTWTDVSEWVELQEQIQIDYARADEFSTCDPNTCKLTLDNSDGRFTARRAASPYYPDVRVGRPLRVSATRVGSLDPPSVRFVGYIDEWPVEWEGTDAHALARISATSRLARLGEKLRAVISEEVAADSPLRYYTLGEPAEATAAADSSGNSGDPLVATSTGSPVVFGSATGPGADGLTAATFTTVVGPGMYLTTTVSISGVTTVTLEAFANTLQDGGVAELSGAAGDRMSLGVLPTGEIYAQILGSGGTVVEVTGSGVDDGAVRAFAYRATLAAGTMTGELFVDGVSVGTDSAAYSSYPTFTALKVGANPAAGIGTLEGSVAHVAVYAGATELSDARIAAHAEGGLTGFVGETPGERVERYASYARIPAAEVDADAGTSPMAHVNTDDQSALDLLRIVETTEYGVLHDGRDNTLEFRDRAARLLAASSFTLSMAAQQIENGVAPKVDRTALLNSVKAALSDGTVEVIVEDAASIEDYGRKGTDLSLATTDANAPNSLASWLVNTYKEPRTRIPALAVDLLALSGSVQDDVLAADVGTRFAVTGYPDQAEASSGDYFVEGYTETIGPESYFFSFNVSDASVLTDTFVFDSATRGKFDVNRFA